MNSVARPSWKKKLVLITLGCLAFVILFVLAIRITVNELLFTIENSRAPGLSAVTWDPRSMWGNSVGSMDSANLSLPTDRESWVARTAELQSHTSAFEQTVGKLHGIVDTHRGYFEDLRTQSLSGRGRALAAGIVVPSEEFDATLSELRALGRIISISQAGEDAAVKLANSARHLSSTQTNLSRLQKLQAERKGELRDAAALEKDIAQANGALAEAIRKQGELKSTVAQSHIRFLLLEDYRAPLQISAADVALQLRNALVLGIAAVFSSFSLVVGVLFNYGLPLLFWLIPVFFLFRLIRRRFQRAPVLKPGI